MAAQTAFQAASRGGQQEKSPKVPEWSAISSAEEEPEEEEEEEEARGGMPIVLYDPVAEPAELRKLVKDAIYYLGGQYAILIQFAHPGLARGTAEHSNFAGRILNRLRTTSRFMNAAVFGTPEQRKKIFSVIHRKHSVVKGEGYSADDRELHRWTAATLFMALVVVHEAFFGPLPRAKMEELYRESSVYGTSLRMPTEMWPETLDDFFIYWHDNLETLEITHWAKELANHLMYPINIPWYLQPMQPVTRLLTSAWLPERLRIAYNLPDSGTTIRKGAYGFIKFYVGLTYPLLPTLVREAPHRYYMKDMEEAIRRIDATGHWN